ncbi:MAG TPA: GNAT family N-acetyltransferase [Azospirillum sp.]|nr:GNAT family N-acetyltransferase [Azospirillum sp.]
MPIELHIRPAEPDDALAVADLMVMAGGGIYDFLLDGLLGGAPVAQMLAAGVAGTAGSFSYRQCTVAEADGVVIGLAHAYPALWMRDVDRTGFPADRLEHIRAFDETQDWGSLFLSALAVVPGWRRRGVAGRLLEAVYGRARAIGFDRVTLHVWADNAPARHLYERQGFTEAGHAAIPWHPRLPHEGGSHLLRRAV